MDWVKYKLSDVVQFNPTERLAKGTIAKKVAMENLHPFTRAISGYELAAYSGGSKFRNGDTLMARITPCLENGKTAYVSILDDEEVGFGSTEYIVFRNIEGVTDSKFIYYFVSNPWFRNIAIKSMVGSSGRQRVQQSVLENLEINLPPLAEQKRIAAILGALDDKIELNHRINANLEEQAKALFKEWFVDFEPFKDGNFVDSELGPIPVGWSVGPIYAYMDVIYGAPYKSSLFNTNKKGFPLIRIRDLKTYSPQFYTEELLSNTEYVECGDIVAGMDAEFMPYIWRGDKGLLNQRVCKFIPKYDYVSNFYIYLVIRPELEFVQSYKVGTTVSHLGKSDIDKIKVIIPSKGVTEKFSRIVDSYLSEIIKIANENRRLAALRDALLSKLMNGEI
ncbi:restriction endonuclease subunit S [uncultured Alistipes sp.]|uniref:restriction endonuclease subunit S n=1 Tax=uncultured Alistipes sp. TaxID=538949 RepID=UPI0025A96EB7|nr:restriction endonuclease subunit S [uncultured Alistipes sp.]